jgi:hypothetical protein
MTFYPSQSSEQSLEQVATQSDYLPRFALADYARAADMRLNHIRN